MNNTNLTHRAALIRALGVTFLWATSWVFIKIGVKNIPALYFAGLRYGLAFLCLLPLFIRSGVKTELKKVNRSMWVKLSLLGILYYSLTQGSQFVSLGYLPAVTVNVILSFSTILIAIAGLVFLKERVTLWQWVGIGAATLGVLLYFWVPKFSATEIPGLVAGGVCLVCNVASSIMGRIVNRERNLSPLTVTTISMGIGGTLLFVFGVIGQGFPQLGWKEWLIVIWLAVMNTAFAFTVWNQTLRVLPAMESSMINNTLSIQIPVLAILFLDETLNIRQMIGMLVAIVGNLLVQLGRSRR